MGQPDANRAQSTAVGFVLIFGILILALASFQTTVVPDANGQVEYQSYLDSSDDLTQLQTDVSRAASGSRVATDVTLGTTYPPRVFFINPPPPAGRLETTTPRNLTLSNVSAVNGETADFWDGTAQNYTFTSLRFTPRYNEINAEPVVTNGILTSRDATVRSIPLTAQAAIQGTRISLPVTQGSVSESGLGVTVISDPVSQSQHTVPVTADQTPGDNVTLTIPTQIAAATWEDDILTNQLVSNGGNVIGVSPTNSSAVRVELAARDASGDLITYQLQLSLIEFRSQSSPASVATPPAYLTTDDRTQRTILTDDTAVLQTQVRDAFNNPIAGTDVTYTLNTTANGDLAGDTDGDGQVTVTTDSAGALAEYAPQTAGPVEITAQADADQNGTIEADEEVRYVVTATTTGTGPAAGSAVNVTNGGVSTWTSSQDTEVLAAPNGRWQGIAETGSLNISKGEYGYDYGNTRPEFLLEFAITNDTATYGVRVNLADGTTPTVMLTSDSNMPTATLTASAAAELSDSDSTAVNILDTQNSSIYASTSTSFRTNAANIRNMTPGNETAVVRTGLGRARATVRFDAAISRYTSGTGGNNGGSSLQNIATSATTSGGSGKASFALQNTGNSAVTITGLAINSTTSGATEVSRQGNNNPSVISNTTGDLFFGTINIGGQRVTFDQNEQLGAGETTEIELDRFDADVRGEDVVITVYLADGSSEQFTLNY